MCAELNYPQPWVCFGCGQAIPLECRFFHSHVSCPETLTVVSVRAAVQNLMNRMRSDNISGDQLLWELSNTLHMQHLLIDDAANNAPTQDTD